MLGTVCPWRIAGRICARTAALSNTHKTGRNPGPSRAYVVASPGLGDRGRVEHDPAFPRLRETDRGVSGLGGRRRLGVDGRVGGGGGCVAAAERTVIVSIAGHVLF